MNITISNGIITAQINPKGAELISLKHNDREYIWEGNPEYWGKHSPVLFPIVGTLKNNSYLYNNKSYALSRHGFARDNEFTVKEKSESKAVFSLVYNTDTLKAYPFKFELELRYTLSGTSLSIEYIIKNNDEKAMPFSIGAHPAFALPKNFESYSLKFEEDDKLVSTQLENDLLSAKTHTIETINRKLPLSYTLFDNDALIFKDLQSKSITILENDNPVLKVNFPEFPHLGIWTKSGAPFICIEPWQGYSDGIDSNGLLTEKEGMLILETGSTYTTAFTIDICK